MRKTSGNSVIQATGKRARAGRIKAADLLQDELKGVREVQFPHVRGRKSCRSSCGAMVWIFRSFLTLPTARLSSSIVVDCYPEIRTNMTADYSDWTAATRRGGKRWGGVMRWGNR